MSVTSTQSKNPASVSQIAVGSYIETGAAVAVTITVGFKPRYVRVENETSRDGYEWYEGMADAEAIKHIAVGTRTLITSNGITVSDRGFIIGLDTDVNASSEQLSWMAIQ